MEERSSGNVVSEKSFLVTVLLPKKPDAVGSLPGDAGEEPLDELHGLAEAAGTTVVGEMIQRRTSIRTRKPTFGSGKVLELKGMVEKTEADVVIFDNDLAPSPDAQSRKGIETLKFWTETDADSRYFLASRAQTKESRFGGRTCAIGILASASETALDASFTTEKGRRTSRTGANAARNGPATCAEADFRPEIGAFDSAAPQGTGGSISESDADRFARRVHECGKKHAFECADRLGCVRERPAFCDARHAHSTLDFTGLGTDFAERHGGVCAQCRIIWWRVSPQRSKEARWCRPSLHVADGSIRLVMFKFQAAYDVLEKFGNSGKRHDFSY